MGDQPPLVKEANRTIQQNERTKERHMYHVATQLPVVFETKVKRLDEEHNRDANDGDENQNLFGHALKCPTSVGRVLLTRFAPPFSCRMRRSLYIKYGLPKSITGMQHIAVKTNKPSKND